MSEKLSWGYVHEVFYEKGHFTIKPEGEFSKADVKKLGDLPFLLRYFINKDDKLTLLLHNGGVRVGFLPPLENSFFVRSILCFVILLNFVFYFNFLFFIKIIIKHKLGFSLL